MWWSAKTGCFGIGFPNWHALLFEGGVIVDMKVVCPQCEKHLFRNQKTQAAGKTWTAEHECEDLQWTARHVNVARKLTVAGGWTQKRSRGCAEGGDKQEGTEKHTQVERSGRKSLSSSDNGNTGPHHQE